MNQTPLWTPPQDRQEASNLRRFLASLSAVHKSLSGFDDLHAFSIAEPEAFWTAIWDFAGIKAARRGERVLIDGHKMPGARFFPDAELNFAENLLVKSDETSALVFRGETGATRTVSWRELQQAVSRLSQGLAQAGLEPGDRVAAVVPNMPETIMASLATLAFGGIWSSCSPDFGVNGILDRFGQIGPKVLVASDGYTYNGRTFDIGNKLAEVVGRLPEVELVLLIDYIGRAEEIASRIPKARTLDSFMAAHAPGAIEFARLPFDHPLYILFSSGTTGVPKCIVHRSGGVLLKHLCEQQLHTDLKPSDRLFYFTTCGWMMWNWLMSGLATGATLLLYDGSPVYPSETALFDFACDEAMTVFGTSAKFLDGIKKTGWRPADTHDLSSLRTMLSTGSPLAPESFDFVYEAIKPDLHLASISGGTDLCGCLVLGNPLAPVWRGEIQAKALGLDVDVFDEAGRPLATGKGELVCRNPFPSMPLRFWNDADGEKYHGAYFARFPGVWNHGDFAEHTPHGGLIIHGRSDATLNPGGVRIGTAEIYAQVEQIPEIVEALAIGQDWDNDVRIVLFVRLKDGAALDEPLRQQIRARIKAGASPRHVPARIVAVADIPRTKSGKITELAVRDVVHGREVKNQEALANPEALELFRDLAELRS
ncbi:MAG TPA: acetoacetate--CoA ligase [Aestuariivirgaceae bacterium]|nr:acetoacetate--CoA ligase [Aestuariivirgaceae bacterium]